MKPLVVAAAALAFAACMAPDTADSCRTACRKLCGWGRADCESECTAERECDELPEAELAELEPEPVAR
ncbi:hypothetical protein WMF30_40045 [Sorangium sp. So ce134]